jgi:hypothetical protein
MTLKDVGIYNANYALGSKFFLLLSPIFMVILSPKIYKNISISLRKDEIKKIASKYLLTGILILTILFFNTDFIGLLFLNKTYDDKGNENGEELYFISVKYFKEEKEISEYDIGKLCSLIREHEKKNRVIKLYIFVRDKKNAINKFNAQHSSSNILIKYINPGGKYEHIYDINDLQVAFFKLKKILEQYDYLQSPNNIHDFQSNYLNVLKDVFIPRFHQELFILKINKLIKNGEKNILVGNV